MQTNPAQLLLIRMIILANTYDHGLLLDIFRDLGFDMQIAGLDRDQVYLGSKPYKEICIGCLTYTGQPLALDVLDNCPNCGSLGGQYSVLAHTLGIETHSGIGRRVLSQLIYQALDGENLGEYRRYLGCVPSK